jgi:two-component system, NarL family, sensor histidine kinase DesK
VDIQTQPPTPTEAEWVAAQRRWADRRSRIFWVALPLVYLIYVYVSVGQNSHGAAAAAGYVVLTVFACCLLLTPLLIPDPVRARRFWLVYAVLFALFVIELPFARAAAFVMCLYLTMLIVARLRLWAVPAVIVMAVAALVVPVAVTSWHVSLVKAVDDFTPVAIPVVAFVTFAVMQVLRGNTALAEARAELARLAAENERIRIARDLHDLLGHSLTTITVKAGLARRLGAVDSVRANQEIAEVETLARRALTEMRSAVSNYREMSLSSELATGRELLRAAGIVPDLPRAVDVVDAEHAELFGWVVREGLTNVVRHAHASTCSVRLSESSVEIVDDGVGGTADAGNGLAGLRERVAAVGGVLDAGPVQPKGWRLRVALTPVPST